MHMYIIKGTAERVQLCMDELDEHTFRTFRLKNKIAVSVKHT